MKVLIQCFLLRWHWIFTYLGVQSKSFLNYLSSFENCNRLSKNSEFPENLSLNKKIFEANQPMVIGFDRKSAKKTNI